MIISFDNPGVMKRPDPPEWLLITIILVTFVVVLIW